MPPKRKSKGSDALKNDKDITDAFKRVKKPTINTLKKSSSVEVDIGSIQDRLRSFDLNCDYGPIIGITRLDRLIRAEYFNLSVNSDVTAILKDTELMQKYPELNMNIWHNIENLL